MVKADWPEVVLCRATAVADPENYGVFHAEHAPVGLSEAKRYVPKDTSLVTDLEAAARRTIDDRTREELEALIDRHKEEGRR